MMRQTSGPVTRRDGRETPELSGIYPIVYTPFTAAGEIDAADVRRLVEHLLAAGAHGIAACGEASEASKMTLDERMGLAALIVACVAGRVPLIVGVSAPTTADQVRLARHASELGAQAVFALPPPVAGAPHAGRASAADRGAAVQRHYEELGHASLTPIMVQEKTEPLAPAVLAALHERCPNIRYVKEEAADTGHRITAILACTGPRVRVFSGGLNLIDELARGAAGAIPGSVGVADLSQAYELHAQGDSVAARRAFYHFLPLAHWRRPFPHLGAKEVLRRQGIFTAARMRPPTDQALDAHDRRELDAIMQAMGPPY